MSFPIHPLIVHFPIALFFTSVFFDFLGMITENKNLRQTGLWLLILGLVGGIVAAAFGFWGEKAALDMGVPEKAVERHETFAIMTLIVFGILLGFRRWVIKHRWSVQNRLLYLCGALLGLIFLATTGYYGGELVFRFGAGVHLSAGTPAGNSESPPIIE